MVKNLLLKRSGIIVYVMLLMSMMSWAQTTVINFDTAANWTAGSAGITGYASNHQYNDSGWTFTGGPALRQTTSNQDGFAGALGTYAWRTTDNNSVTWTATYNASGTISAFGFSVRRWDSSPAPVYNVSYSTDGGETYSSSVLTINNTYLGTSNWSVFSYTLTNPATVTAGKFIVRILKTSGERIMIDDFSFALTTADPTAVLNPEISATGSSTANDTFNGGATVAIATATADATIYYTTNGDTPTTSSTQYIAPFPVTSTATVKAFAVKSGLTDSGVTTKALTINPIGVASLPYGQPFNNTLGEWYNYSTENNMAWIPNSLGAYANGYGSNGAVESWLISPKFTNINGALISFDLTNTYDGNNLVLVYSTNYDGYSNPSTATWTTINTYVPPSGSSQVTNNYSDILIPANGNVQFAFKYAGPLSNNYSAWYVKNFTATAPVPVVTTTQIVADVNTTTTATSGGAVTTPFGTVSAKGVVWGTSTNPTVSLTTKTNEGAGSGTTPDTFASTLTGLNTNTLYYYRAYATNGGGTGYGTQYSFTTLAFVPGAPVVTQPQVPTLTVSVAANGNNTAVKYSIRINGGAYTDQFVQADGTVGTTEVFRTAAQWENTAVTGLTDNTAYTFDSRAQNNVGDLTLYSAATTESTLENIYPTLALDASELVFGEVCTNASATGSFTFSGINISTPGSMLVNQLNGYSYSLTEDGTYTNSLIVNDFTGAPVTVYVKFAPTGVATYSYDIIVEGIDANSIAYLAVPAEGDGINTPGTVTTLGITTTEITENNALLHASATEGCSELFVYGFEYSTTADFSANTAQEIATNYNGSNFSATLSNLLPNTTYYYKALISDDSGDYYGNVLSFSTLALGTPVATAGTDVALDSFTANWTAVSGAESYRLDVSTEESFGAGNLATDLFFSEYVEGSSSNKYLEIFNGTGHSVDLSDYRVQIFANGNTTVSANSILSGTLAHGATIVYRDGAASIYSGAATNLAATNYNGNDAVALYKISTASYVDIIGRIGTDPGSAWSADGGYSTMDKTLVRKSSVYHGVTVNPADSSPATGTFPTLATEWDVYDTNTVSNLGSHDFDYAPSYLPGYENLTVNGTSQAVTGLESNTTYYFRVRAYSSSNTSINSNIIAVTTPSTNITWMIPEGQSAAQWVPAGAPADFDNAIIDADYNTATAGGFAAQTLVVNAGKNFTIAPNTTVTLTEGLVNNATAANFIVQDNGALLQTGTAANTTAITVIKNSSSLYRFDYTLWSAPVTGQNLKEFSPFTLNNRFYEYAYSTNSNGETLEAYWSVDPLTNTFAAAKGYLIRMPNTDALPGFDAGTADMQYTGTFAGIPNNGAINTPLSTNANRFTAVGNPYPSPISVEAFFAANNGAINQSSGIYFWRKRNNANNGSYATLTLAGLNPNESGDNAENSTGGQNNDVYFPTDNSSSWTIAPGQGFFVQTSSTATGSPVAVFNNGMRTAAPATGGQSFFRSAESTVSRYRIRLTNTAGGFSQMMVAYMPQATTALDYCYDAVKLSEGGYISFYTIAESTNLSIQARPAFDNADVVPAGYIATQAGAYTITISYTDGLFADGQKVYVKDNANGTVHELTTSGYTFTTEAGTFNDRFEILYTNSTLSTDNPVLTANNVVIYQNNGTVNVNGGAAIINTINVFDVRGRKLYNSTNINATEASINNLEAAQQVLIIEVNTDKGTVNKKIVF